MDCATSPEEWTLFGFGPASAYQGHTLRPTGLTAAAIRPIKRSLESGSDLRHRNESRHARGCQERLVRPAFPPTRQGEPGWRASVLGGRQAGSRKRRAMSRISLNAARCSAASLAGSVAAGPRGGPNARHPAPPIVSDRTRRESECAPACASSRPCRMRDVRAERRTRLALALAGAASRRLHDDVGDAEVALQRTLSHLDVLHVLEADRRLVHDPRCRGESEGSDRSGRTTSCRTADGCATYAMTSGAIRSRSERG